MVTRKKSQKKPPVSKWELQGRRWEKKGLVTSVVKTCVKTKDGKEVMGRILLPLPARLNTKALAAWEGEWKRWQREHKIKLPMKINDILAMALRLQVQTKIHEKLRNVLKERGDL